MNRQEKSDLVKTLHNTFEGSTSVVVVHCNGLTVSESTELRNKMREENCNFKVTKNKIARLALKETSIVTWMICLKGQLLLVLLKIL